MARGVSPKGRRVDAGAAVVVPQIRVQVGEHLGGLEVQQAPRLSEGLLQTDRRAVQQLQESRTMGTGWVGDAVAGADVDMTALMKLPPWRLTIETVCIKTVIMTASHFSAEREREMIPVTGNGRFIFTLHLLILDDSKIGISKSETGAVNGRAAEGSKGSAGGGEPPPYNDS
ncbi:hypothetical protein EYF80_037228 [Liparis tanakae]|uniref:Uncharacterized protein n=1 Tax=Liparis tanakae TaxID=230148 RepID=A0A4Z2GII6_9TELE|nr:hypothetical protein EYF80_037228 [Liparis tanakae]